VYIPPRNALGGSTPEQVLDDPENRAAPRLDDEKAGLWLTLLAVAAVGTLAARVATAHGFLGFHMVAEGFSVVVGSAIFLVAWNTRAVSDSSALQVLGLGYLSVAILDSLHALAYHGMGILPEDGGNHATQLWLAARAVESITLLVTPWLLGKRVRLWLPESIFAGVTVVLVAAIVTNCLPTCLDPETGLTWFKKISEYVIVVILVAAMVSLYYRRDLLDRGILHLLLASVLVTICSEVAFTLYHDPYGAFNEVGHVLKVISFYLIYRATVRVGLRQPYRLMFLNLRRSQRRLEEANHELAGYAHTVSHDLKGPLSAMVTGGELLSEFAGRPQGVSQEELVRVSGLIRRSGFKAIRLIDDLLALAEAGQEPRRIETVLVKEVVERVLEENQELIESRGIEVVVAAGLGTVNAAPTHVYQIFSNLIRNALRYAEGTPPRVEVKRLAEPDPKVSRFQVRDNGPGFPEELIEHVFEPFVKGDDGGQGIGLSAVSRAVKVYGGEARASNQGGACLEFTLHDRPISPAGTTAVGNAR